MSRKLHRCASLEFTLRKSFLVETSRFAGLAYEVHVIHRPMINIEAWHCRFAHIEVRNKATRQG